MLQFVLFLVAMVIIIIITLFVVKLRKTTQEEWEKFKQKQERETALLKSVTDVDRGDWAERKTVLTLLNLGLKPTAIFHDLYVKVGEGRYSQIDLVVATKVGILVFEIKDYSGWIFGKGSQSYWTQVLAYGEEKHRFYNPIKQNQKHISVLRDRLLKYAEVPFYSIVVFYGNCLLKDVSEIPPATYILYASELSSYLSKLLEEKPIAYYKDKIGVVQVLKQAVLNGARDDVRQKHIENISKRHL